MYTYIYTHPPTHTHTHLRVLDHLRFEFLNLLALLSHLRLDVRDVVLQLLLVTHNHLLDFLVVSSAREVEHKVW